jgi:cell division protease FtsH
MTRERAFRLGPNLPVLWHWDAVKLFEAERVGKGPVMSYVDPKLKANRVTFVLVISIVTLLLFGPPLYAIVGQSLPSRNASYVEIPFSQLVNDVDAGRVRDMQIKEAEIYGTFSDGHHFQTDVPADPALIQGLYNKGVSITKLP